MSETSSEYKISSFRFWKKIENLQLSFAEAVCKYEN